MKSTLALILLGGASGALAVCGGIQAAIAVGTTEQCPLSGFENEPCTFQGQAWDVNCNLIAQGNEPNANYASAVCGSYDNNFSVTCQNGHDNVIGALNLFGVRYTCQPSSENCGKFDGGYGNMINACCYAD